MAIHVRQLRDSDDRAAFRSGHADLDGFFTRYAGQNQFRLHIGTTYVAIDDADTIAGYATVASCPIEVAEIPKRLVKRLLTYPIPALRLARMAVADGLQRAGVGSLLMKAVFVIAREQARRTGCAFVIVDAKPGLETYYERWGFEALPVEAGELDTRPIPTPMFLELAAIPDTKETIPGI